MAKILIIEDETPLRSEVMDWLTFEGFEAIGAVDGLDGVESAVAHHPDLILCDIAMPRLDGFEVLLRLREVDALRATPFVFVSARADQENIKTGLHLGVHAYLTKPFTREELFAVIRDCFEKNAPANDSG